MKEAAFDYVMARTKGGWALVCNAEWPTGGMREPIRLATARAVMRRTKAGVVRSKKRDQA